MAKGHRHKAYLTYSIALSLCVGCTSARTPDPEVRLLTLIRDNGLKLFEMHFPLPPRDSPLEGNRRQQKPRLDERRMQAALEERMAVTGFCREGYLLLGRHSGVTVQTLRGECRDRATKEDRERFEDTIQQW